MLSASLVLMKSSPSLVLTVLSASLVPDYNDEGHRVVCYYTNWSQYRPGTGKFKPHNIPLDLCTHIIYAFSNMEGNSLTAFEWNDDDTEYRGGM